MIFFFFTRFIFSEEINPHALDPPSPQDEKTPTEDEKTAKEREERLKKIQDEQPEELHIIKKEKIDQDGDVEDPEFPQDQLDDEDEKRKEDLDEIVEEVKNQEENEAKVENLQESDDQQNKENASYIQKELNQESEAKDDQKMTEFLSRINDVQELPAENNSLDDNQKEESLNENEDPDEDSDEDYTEERVIHNRVFKGGKGIRIGKKSERREDEEKRKIPEINCTSPNTEPKYGRCFCLSGYIGDPKSEIGCYKCQNECGNQRECVYPGECKCRLNMIEKDENCVAPVPHLKDISSFSVYEMLGINISYQSENNFHPYLVYAKIDETLFHSNIDDDNMVWFLIPHGIDGIHSISISFDGKEFSNAKNFNIPKQILYEKKKNKKKETVEKQSFVFKGSCYIICYIAICLSLLTLKIDPRSLRKAKESHPLLAGNELEIYPHTKERKRVD